MTTRAVGNNEEVAETWELRESHTPLEVVDLRSSNREEAQLKHDCVPSHDASWNVTNSTAADAQYGTMYRGCQTRSETGKKCLAWPKGTEGTVQKDDDVCLKANTNGGADFSSFTCKTAA